MPADWFQFLGRNSGRSDLILVTGITRMFLKFQFLGRNSGRSDGEGEPEESESEPGFNSSVGILVVRTPCPGSVPASGTGFNSSVGILVVRTELTSRATSWKLWCFNSSVGILVVRTWVGHRGIARPASFNSSVGIPVVRTRANFQKSCCASPWFQFLGRNSGRSDEALVEW